jgi:hypothetical protein
MNSTLPTEISAIQTRLSIEIFNKKMDFEKTAMEIFRIQSKYCAPYKRYISLLGIAAEEIKNTTDIPFLPVSLYKNHEIKCYNGTEEALFTSSSTTGQIPSRHYIKELSLYEKSFMESFRLFIGTPSDFTILALLPSYLERKGSSLVYMAEHLIKESNKKESGFYLYNHKELHKTLLQLKQSGQKTILLGVTFALLDFIQNYPLDFPSLKVIETGGMKGRKKELNRKEVHHVLSEGFGTEVIGSEYGMAELLSQAWSSGHGLFTPPPWMKIVIRDNTNPFTSASKGHEGGVNIIDLANIYSCSFIETMDKGIKEAGESFRITGRIKNSEIRGCNLLLED